MPRTPCPRAIFLPTRSTKARFSRERSGNYTLYVPKQYDPAKPACVYVGQDGVGFNAPAVFDQLIHEKAMPVTVGVFVTPGNAAGRGNRSFEYDAMTDDYVRFLADELLPYIAKTHKLNLSTDGNDRAIAGTSSGGICAFTAAWERPDAFRRVFSNVGSFGAHRGGYVYPILVRKFEPKPIRVFLQDGSNDLKFAYGDWLLANQEMEQALTFAGYEVAHSWDKGGHEMKYATKIFPDAMRWLWKDWPKPIKAGAGSAYHQQILLPGENVETRRRPLSRCDQPDGERQGRSVLLRRAGRQDLQDRIGRKGRRFPGRLPTRRRLGLRPRADCCMRPRAIRSWPTMPRPRATVVAREIRGHRVAVGLNGNIYVTSRAEERDKGSKLWLINACRREMRGRRRFEACRMGVAFTADQRFLCVTDGSMHQVYSYLDSAGRVAHRQAAVLFPPRRHGRQQRRRRHVCGSRRPRLRGHADGGPSL